MCKDTFFFLNGKILFCKAVGLVVDNVERVLKGVSDGHRPLRATVLQFGFGNLVFQL